MKANRLTTLLICLSLGACADLQRMVDQLTMEPDNKAQTTPAPPPAQADAKTMGSEIPPPMIPQAGQPVDQMEQARVIDERRRLDEERQRRREMELSNAMAQDNVKREASIAIDLLDRMYAKCNGGRDPVACATFQAYWGELSKQLRKVVQ